MVAADDLSGAGAGRCWKGERAAEWLWMGLVFENKTR
jgi:hypothetical protein